MAQDFIVVDKKDNVATALRRLEGESCVRIEMASCNIDVTLSQSIPMGHKFALKDIEAGDPIIKYGEVIGLATKSIRKGEHTHIHNVEGLRGRGDRQ